MDYKISEMNQQTFDFDGIGDTFFLVGLLNEFMNRFQTAGDTFFDEISWRQCFVLICLGLFREAPSLKELSEVMGCSHQNAKQLILKLEKAGFLRVEQDEKDKRKQRIYKTEKAEVFDAKYDEPSAKFMEFLYQGVSREKLAVTIQTIAQMDENLKRWRKSLKQRGSG